MEGGAHSRFDVHHIHGVPRWLVSHHSSYMYVSSHHTPFPDKKFFSFSEDTKCKFSCDADDLYTLILDYDQVTIDGKNKLLESINAYKQVVSATETMSPNVATVLVLAKHNEFREKLSTISIRVCFPDFPSSLHDSDFQDCVNYVAKECAASGLYSKSRAKYLSPHPRGLHIQMAQYRHYLTFVVLIFHVIFFTSVSLCTLCMYRRDATNLLRWGRLYLEPPPSLEGGGRLICTHQRESIQRRPSYSRRCR